VIRTAFVAVCEPGSIALDEEESHYLTRVVRAGPGDAVRVTDGRGRAGWGRLLAGGRNARVQVDEVIDAPESPPILVLLGLPRPALVDEALQLGTEAGATAFHLFPATHSPVGRPRADRLERVADAAVRQCRRERRPELHAHASLSDALANAALPLARFLAAPGASTPPSPGPCCALAVGPEAGFTEAEVRQFLGAGFVPVLLGPYILRAPTAVAIGLALATCR
jgi:16S rRNA (uracil1498-N3)-methyltransferase